MGASHNSGEPIARVFISYSRKDRDRARDLSDALTDRGYEIFLDSEDILPTEEWKERLETLIANADLVIFLLSKHSAKSEVCGWEVEHATSLNKRIAPVVIDDVDPRAIPPLLARLNFIFCTVRDRLDDAVDILETAIQNNIGWIREHTRILTLADRWRKTDQRDSMLLRGQDLVDAENWRDRRPEQAPAVSELQARFISEGRRSTVARQRKWLGGSLAVAAATAALAVVAYLQSVEADRQRDVADAQRIEAEAAADRALLTESKFLARAAHQLVGEGDVSDALALAHIALPTPPEFDDRPLAPEAISALRRSLYWNKEFRVFGNEGEGVTSIAFSPDGKMLVTSSNENGVSIWDVATGERLTQFLAHSGEVFAASFSPDGAEVVTAGRDGTARVFGVVSGEERLVLRGHEMGIDHVGFSPDGAFVVTGSSDSTARIWRTADGSEVSMMVGHRGWLADLAFSPDGMLLLTGGSDSTARLWSVEDGREIAILAGHDHFVWDVEFSPNGDRILTGSTDGTARVWNLEGQVLTTFSGHEAGVLSATFSADGMRVLTGSEDFTAAIWDAESGRRLTSLVAHNGKVAKVLEDPVTGDIFTSSNDGTVIIWRRGESYPGSVLGRHEIRTPEFAIDPESRTVATGTLSGRPRLWRRSFGNGAADIGAPNAGLVSFALHPHEDIALTASEDGSLGLWDIRSETLLHQLEAHTGTLKAVEFSSDGEIAASASEEGLIAIWKVSDGTKLATLQSDFLIADISIFDGGGKVASISNQGVIQTWDVMEGRVIASLQAQGIFLEKGSVSPDQKTMVVRGISHPEAFVVSLPALEVLSVLRGHGDGIGDMAFSSDGRLIVTGSRDNTARVWDVGSGAELSVLSGHEYWVTAVAISPDGRHVLTGSLDRTIRIWNSGSGEQISVLAGHEQTVTDVAFHKGGSLILSAAEDGTAKLWSFPDGEKIVDLYWSRLEGVGILEARFSQSGRLIMGRADDRLTRLDSLARVWPVWPNLSDLFQDGSEILSSLEPLSAADRCEYFQAEPSEC